MAEFVLNRFIVEGVHYEYLPGRWQAATDDNYGVSAMSYKTINQDRVVVVQKPYSATNANVGKRKVVKQAWAAGFDQESFLDVCMYDHMKHLYETQAHFWLQYDDEMSRCFAVARPLYGERQVYLTPTFPIFPKGWTPTNGATFTVYVDDVEVTTGFTVDQENGLIVFDTPHLTDVEVLVAYTWRAYVRIATFNVQPAVLAQHVYVGDILFEQVPCDFDDERYNLSYTCVTCQNDELVDPLDGPGYRGETPTISTCTAWTAAGAAATINRTGWTDDFTSPTNARVSDNTYATAAMTSGDVTKLLQGTSMIPAPTVPTGATLDSVRFRVEHSLAGGETKFPVIQDEAYVLVSGVRVGSNLATLQLVPDTDTYETYTIVPPLPAGVTVANLNAGNIGFEIGYRSSTNADHLNPSNWNISVSGNAAFGPESLGYSTTTVATITATYTGPGAAPPSVNVSVTSSAIIALDGALGSINVPTTLTADNGLGATDTITGSSIENIGANAFTATSLRIPLTAGTGSRQLTLSVTSTAGGDAPVSGDLTVGASFTSWTAATLQIDAMEISACYSTT